ncbi:MAG TPA: MarC family NAAT transporter [Kiloniellaceae bacterium]|nr:MarC family NAAT transporter [Kiloniellaceae bacterium]
MAWFRIQPDRDETMEETLGDVLFEMAYYVMLVFLGLLPVTNPFSTAPAFVALTAGMTEDERGQIASTACVYMSAILLVFLLTGAVILTFFGITVPALRVAGGLIIGYIGFRMLFPADSAGDASDIAAQAGRRRSIAFMPLAMPLLSGPGSIAVVIGMSVEVVESPTVIEDILGYIVVALGIIGTAFVCWLVLKAAGRITRFLGATGIDVLTRLMGFFLIAIAVQFIDAGFGGVLAQ